MDIRAAVRPPGPESRSRPADRFLREFAASLPGAVVLVDGSRAVWSVNPAAADVLGRPAEELVGRPVTDLFESSPDDGGEFVAALERAADPGAAPAAPRQPPTDGAAPSFVLTVADRHRARAPVRVTVDRLAVADRHLVTLVLDAHVDRRAAARLRFAGQGSDAPVILWITGTDAAATWYNAAWSEMTGHDVHVALDEWSDLVHPADREEALDTYLRAVLERQPFEMQYRLRMASGEYRHVLDRGSPHDDRQGRYAGWVGSTVDVTELVQAKEALALGEHRQAAVSILSRMGLGPAPIEEVRQAIVDLLCAELGADAAGYFTTPRRMPTTVRLAAARGWRTELVGATLPRQQLFWIPVTDAELAAGVLVRDWSSETRYRPGTFVAQHGYRSSIAVAVPGDGVISVHRMYRPFGPDDLVHVRDLARVVSAAAAERRSTRSLLDRETMLTLAMQAGRMGHWIYDPDTRRIRFSSALEAMCGMEPGTLGEGWRTFSHFIVPADRIRARRELFPEDPAETEIHTEFRMVRPDGSEAWLEVRGRAVGAAVSAREPFRRWVGVAIDVTEQKNAEREARVVAALSDLFASRHDFDKVMERVVHAVVPELADTCSIHLVGDTPTARCWWLADRDPALERLVTASEAERTFDPLVLFPDLGRPGPHEAYLLDEVTDADRRRVARDAHDLELSSIHGATSVVVAPLEARGRILGLLTLGLRRPKGRRYGDADLRTAEELARRVANAVDNARLERDARQARDRLDVLARVGNILTVSLDSEARLRAVAEAVVPSFADACFIHAGGDDGLLRIAHVAVADPKIERLVAAVPGAAFTVEARVLPAEAIRAGRPILRETREEVERLDTPLGRLLVENGLHSALTVPMPGSGEPGGTPNVITFSLFDPARRFGPEDVALAVELARRAAPALQHAVSFQREQHTAEVLQRNLLPDRLPTVPGVTFSSCYLPGEAGLAVGGDWYDVLHLADGRVLLTVGDVVGLGIPAAMNMGRIRTVLQYCAMDDPDPASLLSRLNAHLRALPDGEMATVALLLYDAASGRAVLASAGHLPLLLQEPGGRVRTLPTPNGAPLRASASSRYTDEVVDLPPGSTVVLYTDGLVERRGESLDEGFAHLAGAATSIGESPPDLAQRLVDRMIGDRLPPDDTAVLTMHVHRSADLELIIPSRTGELARVRAVLRNWLTRLGARPDETDEIVLAVNEAVSNSVIHAYGIAGGEVLVRAWTRPVEEGGEMEVVVRDHGRWRPSGPYGTNDGRGIDVMRALMDAVEIEPGTEESATGTTVVLRRRLGGRDGPG